MDECEQNPTMMETLEWLIQDYDDGSSVALSVVSLRMILNEHAHLEEELATSMAYADKLAAGLPDGMLPKDVEVLRRANSRFAEENAALKWENEALKEYATHKPGCYENDDLCICGLDTLLAGRK